MLHGPAGAPTCIYLNCPPDAKPAHGRSDGGPAAGAGTRCVMYERPAGDAARYIIEWNKAMAWDNLDDHII